MISTFVLLTVVGGVCRLGLNWVLRRKLGGVLGTASNPGSGFRHPDRPA